MKIEELTDQYLRILRRINVDAKLQIKAIPRHFDARSRAREIEKIMLERASKSRPVVDEMARIEMTRLPSPVRAQNRACGREN